jgi:lipopolysaccharide transport system ATP-binding protein
MEAITAQHLSKRYYIGKFNSGYLYRRLQSYLRRVMEKRTAGAVTASRRNRSVNALHDLSFTIRRGECTGIIGPNGSGKSTLLKILSGVTLPSEGQVIIRGNVASLLGIGTGFQSDLSARENIYLNGAILGMTRRQIHEQFDDIVSFSGIENFVETPVKRFSSGMYIRLAFSIAIHCIADILLIDEILAVADHGFLERCRKKISDYITDGKTIIIVSHNMTTVRELCARVLLLHEGSIVASGTPGAIIPRYERQRPDSAVNVHSVSS